MHAVSYVLSGVEFQVNAYSSNNQYLPSLTALVCDGDSGRIVGIHMIAPDAPEMMQAAAIAVKAGLTEPTSMRPPRSIRPWRKNWCRCAEHGHQAPPPQRVLASHFWQGGDERGQLACAVNPGLLIDMLDMRPHGRDR